MEKQAAFVMGFIVMCTFGGERALAGGDTAGGLTLTGAGEWTVRFAPKRSMLECIHQESGARVAGRLSFTAEINGKMQPWPIIPPRDRVATRLSLLDGKGNVQGYVMFAGSCGTLRITTIHRPEQT